MINSLWLEVASHTEGQNVTIGIYELLRKGENDRLECKLAFQGLPKSLWESYSAFANTSGGIILLGIRENNGMFSIEGVSEPQKLVKEIWACLHNPNKISSCVLFERHVYIEEIEGKNVVVLEVPSADRHDRPVYIGADMFHGTYCRNSEGDYRCTREAVLAMLRDNTDESLDGSLVQDKMVSELNSESVRRYRNIFNNLKPEHVWSTLPDDEFLVKIGAARKDHQGTVYPTRAGMLAFSDFISITQVYPNFFLDYRETDGVTTRWRDRICSGDGTWSGNVFDFYFRITDRLNAFVKMPFQLRGVYRDNTTAANTSIREALANTLIHADYEGRCGIVIEKTPVSIAFSNPGLFRIDVETAISGGISDARNRTLFHIFSLIQLVERAGSGLCTLYATWRNEGLPAPEITERRDLLRTTVTIPSPIFWEQETQGAQKTDQSAQKTNSFLDSRILQLLSENPHVTTTMLAEALGVSRYTIARRLKNMKERGVLERIGPDKGGSWRVYAV